MDPASFSDLGLNADLQIEFRSADLGLRGLLGQAVVPYSRSLSLPLDRLNAAAAWGAWRKPLLVMTGVGSTLAFLTLNTLLGFLFIPAVALGAWIAQRPVTAGGAWKIGIAAWLPASLVLDSVVILYARHWISLTTLAAGLGLTLLAGLYWTASGMWNLPRHAPAQAAPNPFGDEPRPVVTSAPGRSRNPFGG